MPITTVNIAVTVSPTQGSASVNGSTPRIDTHITVLRPMRSPNGPPTSVPSATEAMNTNSSTWADSVERPK
jgi:hypothetical protein